MFCLLFSNFSNCIFAQNPMAFKRSAFRSRYLHHRVLKTIGFQDFFFAKMVVLPLKCHFFEPGRYTQFARYTLS